MLTQYSRSIPRGYPRSLSRGGARDTFISQWDTTKVSAGSSNSDQITYPITSTGDYHIDWGDGNKTTNQDTHTYAAPGVYVTKLTGQIDSFRFNNAGDKLKISNISQWGILKLGNAGNYFHGCGNLDVTATDTPDLTDTTNLSNIWTECLKLVGNSAFDLWETENVTDFTNEFAACFLFNQSLNNRDYSSAVTMKGRLSAAIIYNQVIDWIAPNLLDTSDMLNSALVFNQLVTLSASRPTTTARMFLNTPAYNQPNTLNTLDTTDMDEMYSNSGIDQNLDNIKVTSLITADKFLFGSTLSTSNWSATLVGFSAQSVLPNVPMHGGNSQYSAGIAAAARGVLVASPNFWIITDNGQAP